MMSSFCPVFLLWNIIRQDVECVTPLLYFSPGGDLNMGAESIRLTCGRNLKLSRSALESIDRSIANRFAG